MPHLPEQGDYLTDLDAYCKLHSLPVQPAPPDGDIPSTWPVQIEPTRQQWIESNARPLDLLVQASSRTRFFIPFDGGNRPEMLIEVLIPHVGACRNVGTLLLTRAVMRLQSGDSDGCIGDVLAVHRLARLLSQSPTLIERMSARSFWSPPHYWSIASPLPAGNSQSSKSSPWLRNCTPSAISRHLENMWTASDT